MTHQNSERFNKRDHWPPGICFPPGNVMYARPRILPSDLVRSILTYPQTGDPNFNSIQWLMNIQSVWTNATIGLREYAFHRKFKCMPDLGYYPLLWCGLFLPTHKQAIQILILFNDSPTLRTFKRTRPLASWNMLSTGKCNVCPTSDTTLCLGAVYSYLPTKRQSKF